MVKVGQLIENMRIEVGMTKAKTIRAMEIKHRSMYEYKMRHDTFTWKEVCLFIDHLGYRLSIIKSFGADVKVNVDFSSSSDIIPIVGRDMEIDFNRAGINNVDGSKSVNVEIKVK